MSNISFQINKNSSPKVKNESLIYVGENFALKVFDSSNNLKRFYQLQLEITTHRIKLYQDQNHPIHFDIYYQSIKDYGYDKRGMLSKVQQWRENINQKKKQKQYKIRICIHGYRVQENALEEYYM